MTRKEYFREYCRRRFEEEWKPAYDAFIPLYPFTTENLDGEIWKVIPDFEDYHGSNYGRTKSFKNGEVKIKKPSLTPQGYLYVTLFKNGKRKNFLVNVIVAKLFIPNPDNKPEVNHIYSRFSNHSSCLEWVTSSENKKHALTNGLQPSGEDTYNAKLTNEQIIYIRENPDGLNTYQLAEMFGVRNCTIGRIQRGESFKNAGGSIREKKQGGKPRVPDEMREKILADYQPGIPGHGELAVAKRFGVSPTTVWRIVNEQ